MGDGFSNPILGSQGALVRKQIRSPNFVTGVSGWQIAKDGSAEFNSATVRGTLSIGSPPSQGAVQIGLTGTAVPLVLRNFNVAYTWYEVDVRWIDTTQFFFSGLAFNSTFSRMEVITGLYTTGGGVQLQTFVDSSSSPNSYYLGSSVYDTSPLDYQWRNTNLIINSGCTVLTDSPIQFSNSGVVEPWHAMTGSYLNGWADKAGGFMTGAYRKVASPPNSVQIVGEFTPGTKVDGTHLFNLPAGYRPQTGIVTPIQVDITIATGSNSPGFFINSNGNIDCYSCASSTTVGVNATFPLDHT